MTVKELIEKLKDLPAETQVYAEDSHTWERENPVSGTEWRELERLGKTTVLCILTDRR